jgi:hypothetical protein
MMLEYSQEKLVTAVWIVYTSPLDIWTQAPPPSITDGHAQHWGIHATVELLFGRVPLDQKRKNEIFGMTLKVDVINILVNDSYF